MTHKSVPISPIEFVQMEPTEFSPLISRCIIKVCYVGDEPNRNRSIITKETAVKLAPSLRGNPIIGYFNEEDGDFEEHNKFLDENFKITSNTRPYGFVDLGARVWFQTYLDDDSVEREYLVTEGYLWTKQYPECQRVIDKGNNQSMELDENSLKAEWTKDSKGKYQFFIINEAITSALCLLGEDYEPCFEGATVKAPEIEYSLYDESFKSQLFSMMEEIKNLLKGGKTVVTKLEIATSDYIWTEMYKYLQDKYPNTDYSIDGFYINDEQKYVVVKNSADNKYYRINFSASDETLTIEVNDSMLTEVTSTYQDKTDEEIIENSEEVIEEKADEEEIVTISYNLEEIPEYVELRTQYSELETNYNTVVSELETVKAEKEELLTFKTNIERKEKEALIQSFYMLSEEDKADVVTNIDTYSLDDIEAKLSIICVRNKVSFKEDEKEEASQPTTYTLDNSEDIDATPAWVKKALEVAKNM